MSAAGQEPPVTIRRGRPGDLDAILDLLTEYEIPRAYFEPHYHHDPSYEPAHTWLAEQAGRPLAYLRLFDRTIRVGAAYLRIAGVGHVITAKAARGRGYAGQLLSALLEAATRAGYAYSLLWTHLPALYGRYGWAPIEETLVTLAPPPSLSSAVAIGPFRPDDLPAVMRLYDRANAARTGTTVRSEAYWQGQLRGWAADLPGFLVARAVDGTLCGYVRSRPSDFGAELLELGLLPAEVEAGRALLVAAAPASGHLRGPLPPSLRAVSRPFEREAGRETALMGRTLDLASLLRALEPVWQERARAAALAEGAVQVETSGGRAELRLTTDGLQFTLAPENRAEFPLDERAFAHLLCHGFDAHAEEQFGSRPDAPLLAALFPPQDFVIWPADAF